MTRSGFVLAQLLLLLAVGVHADDAANGKANMERGFVPEKLYQFGGLDTVNLFNGNLTLTIPIGGSYPVSSHLSYGLNLHYNSKVWDYISYNAGQACPSSAAGYASFPVGHPTQRVSAGLGWGLSLGHVFGTETNSLSDRPIYVSPDGAVHEFVAADSNPPTDMTDAPATIQVLYSTGTSSLRMKKNLSDPPQPGSWEFEVDFPDGTIHLFDANGYLIQMKDQFDNIVTVTRAVVNDKWIWTISDTHRVNVIRFMKAYPGGVPINGFDSFEWVVEKVELRSGPTSGGAALTAIYTFGYEVKTIARGCASTNFYPCTADVAVPLLTSVTLPDASTFTFAYHETRSNDACEQGALKRMILPTGGRIDWSYAAYALPANGCASFIDGSDFVNRTPGVSKKEWFASSTATTATATWAYRQLLSEIKKTTGGCPDSTAPDPDSVPGQPIPLKHRGAQYSTTSVTDPVGRTAVHYFATWNDDQVVPDGHAASHNLESDYGLPFTRMEQQPFSDRLLSSQTCTTFSISSQTTPQPVCASARSQYVLYDRSGLLPSMRRAIAQRTVFEGNPTRYIDSISSEFDGFGNFRRTVVTSDFGPTRTTFTDYNAASTSTGTGPNGYLLIAAVQPWILGRYTTQRVEETDGASKSVLVTKACFDAKGLLSGMRWLKENGDSTRDVIARYRYYLGDRIYEDWYGGDQSLLTSSDLCGFPTASPSEYHLEHTYTAGLLTTSQYRDVSFRSVDNTIDAGTGRVLSARDTAEVETRYGYDAMGRLTSVAPTGRAAMAYTYTNASGSTPASVKISRGNLASGQHSLFEFDPWGRVVREGILVPPVAGAQDPNGLLWRYKTTAYDAAGRVQSVSELAPGTTATPPKTEYQYDRFDRVTSVKPPDASVVSYAYTNGGVEIKKRTTSIATPGGAQSIDAWEHYDAHGRLIKVVEKSGPTTSTGYVGEDVTTEYAYDAASRLRFVKMSGAEGPVQSRIFDYDGRGFLRWEMHPESGMNAYTYDSRGKVRTKTVSEANSPYDLKYAYDSAERLTEIAGRNPKYNPSDVVPLYRLQFRPIKTFEYATENELAVPSPAPRPADLGIGKLRAATRYNYPPANMSSTDDDIIKVVERYYYRDAAGRRTDRTTEVWSNDELPGEFRLGADVLFSTDFDTLDQPVSISYPKCIGCAFPDAPGPERVLTSSYSRGRLQSVDGFAGSMTYADNGMRTSLTHANGMVDTQQLDSTGMARPARLFASPSPVVCTAPSVAVQPEGKTIGNGGTATLSVVASGTGPLSYQWHIVSGGAIAGATSSTYVASPSTTTKYYVRVTNACNTAQSFIVTVAVNACSPPTVQASRTVNKDGTVTLSASPVASGPVTCTWHRLADGALVANGTSVVVANAVGIQALEVRAAASGCGTATATLADISPAPPPVTLSATANGTSSVSISWASAGLTTYQLVRRHHGGVTDVFTVSGTQYNDTAVTANTTYTYVLANADRVAISNVDAATTKVFTPIIPKKTQISMSYFDELLAAVNSVRQAAGWPALTWRTIMPPSVDVPAAGQIIQAIHLTALRPRMEEALHALGVSTAGYANPDPRRSEIKASYITELQGRAK